MEKDPIISSADATTSAINAVTHTLRCTSLTRHTVSLNTGELPGTGRNRQETTSELLSEPSDDGEATKGTGGVIEPLTSGRAVLFGEQPDGKPDPEATEALAHLALTKTLEEPTDYEQRLQRQISACVDSLLTRMETTAVPDDIDVQFVAAAEDVPVVKDITSRIVYTFARVALWHNSNFIFSDLPTEVVDSDLGRPDVQLVLETAAAVREVLEAGYAFDEKFVPEHCTQELANLIAKRGPGFARAWIGGEHIREFCKENGFDTEQWLRATPPDERIRIALHCPEDPLSAVRHILEQRDPAFATDIWIARREAYRKYLFGDFEAEAREEKALPSLAAGARRYIPHPMTDAMRKKKENLTTNITILLQRHTERASGNEEAPTAIVGVRQEDIGILGELTASVMWFWRKNSNRQTERLHDKRLPREQHYPTLASLMRDDPPRDEFTSKNALLAVETATAVCEVVHAGYPYGAGMGLEENIDYGELLAKFIAMRGPEYARAWITGRLLRQHDPAAADRWLTLFPPRALADIALRYPQDPLAKLKVAARYFDAIFTPASLQRMTRWDADKVREVFTHDVLVKLAVSRYTPVIGVRRLVQKVDKQLFDSQEQAG